MYQPCENRMRKKKTTRNTPVPIHRYNTYGVDWSSSA